MSGEIMKGGEMINKGVYGCIFDPPLICRGEKAPRGGWKNGKLGKLTTIEDVKGELVAAELFKNKPEAKKYLILPQLGTLCRQGPDGQDALIESEQREKDFGKCDALKEFGFGKMIHFQMEFGGVALRSKLENIKDALKHKFSFAKLVEQLLEIGAFLVLNGFVHNDLHSGNILMDKDYRPRLIDYGRGYYSKTISQTTLNELGAMVYNPSLGQITPECSVQDGLIDKLPLSKMIQDLISDDPNIGKPGLFYADFLFGQAREKEAEEFEHFWKTSKAVRQNDWVSFWKFYWSVVDSWSIGHDLASILNSLILQTQYKNGDEWKSKGYLITKVLTGMLKASPRVRLDCIEALAIYNPKNHILASPTGKAWLQKRSEQRKRSDK